jgi:hypothetical protein
MGAPVRLKSSEFIHAKLRQYASTVAKITGLPVHPNTWFGLKLYDGTVIKVRRSAFEYLDENDPQYDGEDLPAGTGDAQPSYSIQIARKKKKKKTKKRSDSNMAPSKRSRSYLKATDLIGECVVIVNGRYSGRRGYVKKGGNGYFSVALIDKLPGGNSESIMKRSMDLRVIERPSDFDPSEVGKKPSRAGGMNEDYQEDGLDSGSDLSELSVSDDGNISEDSDDEFFPTARFPSSRTFPASRFRPVEKRQRSSGDHGISLIDKRVILTKGKHRGEIGTVKRSGHGFYAVHVHKRGVELMKRASELKLCDVQEITIPVKNGKDLHSAAQILMDMLNGQSEFGSFEEEYGLSEDELQDSTTPLTDIDDQDVFFQDYPPYPPYLQSQSSPMYIAPSSSKLKESFSSSYLAPVWTSSTSSSNGSISSSCSSFARPPTPTTHPSTASSIPVGHSSSSRISSQNADT